MLRGVYAVRFVRARVHKSRMARSRIESIGSNFCMGDERLRWVSAGAASTLGHRVPLRMPGRSGPANGRESTADDNVPVPGRPS